ncbi:MAG: rhamnan synthesis protein F [Oscillospiraceae bacterium]|nr:rhamnan synthesis protein F [Oscillospiraceae bacterium]
MKRIGIYFFFDKDGIVSKCHDHYLDGISSCFERLVIVVNGKLSEEGRVLFSKYSKEIIIRENKGLDVGAYQEGIQHIGWKKIRNYDELVLFNFTNYGPFHPFEEMFEEMERKEIDFWGITKHHGLDYDPYGKCVYGYIPPHIQSSFIAVRKKMLRSEEYKNFWDTMPNIIDYADSISYYEAIFTKKFTDLGFTSDVYVNTDDLIGYAEYPLMVYPTELVKNRKCPVVKRKLFYNIIEEYISCGVGYQAREFYEYMINDTDFDVDLIWDDLLRTTNMHDIKERLHFNYVLSSREETGSTSHTLSAAVFIHIYYIDLLDKIINYLQNVPEGIDIYYTTNTKEKKEVIDQKLSILPNAVKGFVVENRGREYTGFLVCLKKYHSNYDLICILHGKQSLYDKPYVAGEDFFFHCYENTIGSRGYINNIIRTFEENPRLGLLVPPVPYYGAYYSTVGTEWKANYNNTIKLLGKLDIDVPISSSIPPVAPFGGMFWHRSKALEPLFNNAFTVKDFPKEPIKERDGTIMHAIERIYPFVAQSQGYYSACAIKDTYSSLILTTLYKNQRDINQIMFARHGEMDRQQTLGNLYFDLTRLSQFEQQPGLINTDKFVNKDELYPHTFLGKCKAIAKVILGERISNRISVAKRA